MMIPLYAAWLLLVAHVHAASLSLQSPRFVITSSDASQLRAETYVYPSTGSARPDLSTQPTRLSLNQKPEPLTLGPSDTLKLTFQITESDQGSGVQPHQTFLRFYDSLSGEEGIQPVRVTPGGKAKFELVRPLFARQRDLIHSRRTWLIRRCPCHRRQTTHSLSL